MRGDRLLKEDVVIRGIHDVVQHLHTHIEQHRKPASHTPEGGTEGGREGGEGCKLNHQKVWTNWSARGSRLATASPVSFRCLTLLM